MGRSQAFNRATSSKPIVGLTFLIPGSAVLVKQPCPYLTPLTPQQPFLSLVLSFALTQNIHDLLSIDRKIHAFTGDNKHPQTMETLVELAEMKNLREELRWKMQCELDVAWTNARFLTPNPALEGRVPKDEFNCDPDITKDANLNEGKTTNEQLGRYIKGGRKRKAEDEGYISLPVGEQQPKKKVTRKGKGKKPKKLDKMVEYMDLEDEHDKGGWQCGVPLEPLGISTAAVPLTQAEKRRMQGWNWRDAVVRRFSGGVGKEESIGPKDTSVYYYL